MFQGERFTGEQRDFDDLSYRMISFTSGNSSEQMQESMDLWLSQDDAIQKDIAHRFQGFSSRTEDLQTVLGSYRRNRIILSCGYDQYVSWEGGFFIEAETKDGIQALSFLEHCFNQERPSLPADKLILDKGGRPKERIIYGNFPIPHQPIADIPIELTESVLPSGIRCLQIFTGAEHPELMRREMWHGYIEELEVREVPIKTLSIPRHSWNFLNRFRRN